MLGPRAIFMHRAPAREIPPTIGRGNRHGRGVAALNVWTTTLTGLTGTAVAYFCARRVLSGEMTLGESVMYAVFLGVLTGPALQLAGFSAQMAEMLAGIERVQQILDEPQEHDDATRVHVASSAPSVVTFEHVHFGYAPDLPVLRDITFTAPLGAITALAGPSGSGKSTILALAAGFYRATSGVVRVDDMDLATVRLDTYRSSLGLVLQDVFLFSGTIEDNVRFARPEATAEEVLDACRVARVSDFAERLPGGYHTIVGERGIGLSGGERQRISIARAVLARPRILLLDEATSSLDSESEVAIQAALARLTPHCITLLVAHRLSTIRHADQILVLDDGRILERGTHHSLSEAGGWYARTLRAQGNGASASDADRQPSACAAYEQV